MTIDDWSDAAGKFLIFGGAVTMLWSGMRWLYGIGVKRQLDALRADILRALPEAIRLGLDEHVRGWHGRPPPPPEVPSWVQPQPNGTRPPARTGRGAHRAR